MMYRNFAAGQTFWQQNSIGLDVFLLQWGNHDPTTIIVLLKLLPYFGTEYSNKKFYFAGHKSSFP